MKKLDLISELFCLRKLIAEAPEILRGQEAGWQAEFAAKSAALVELELMAYRKKFYPIKKSGP